MSALGFESVTEGDHQALAIRGRLTIANVQLIADELRALVPGGSKLTIDLAKLERMDTAGAWLLHRLMLNWQEAGVKVTVANAGPDTLRLISEIANHDQPMVMHQRPASFIFARLDRIGRAVVQAFDNAGSFLAFIGQTMITIGGTIAGRRSMRWNALIHQCEAIGVNALGIVGLLLFLVGIVVAQQGAVQLRQFGAEVFVVNLIGRSTTRELGILLTAIMVAGRSASAFAAQIGSMKLNQEVDAMETIGVSPSEALVVPRVLGMALMLTLLGFFGTFMALVGGGLFVWTQLGMPPITYVQRLQEVVPLSDFIIGTIKAPVFGLVIAMMGCFHGFQVKGNAEAVGNRTTRAVVESIFVVIVLDAFFAIFFSALGYN
ncbi:sulfate transporter [Polymorphobacter multimanifer]|uniref:Phospholipid/cholesterol/gamma-HCH transport system permease protein n=1 Tax=Polymorphobacter multimanifer TaxID=1070431 RepID=A0A841L4X0_9SPHN|nr:MlaE family lipid ABC transporter permease subunit [Polymorphobacter multimanifer]MBB6227687.1 phospholipid/cholesterol/gamma-HCH transport system permease protein [Polymorphobacter multimanifer]GGI70885.1 sulfate transporter [Polymorphobacter multimanifer]